MTSADDQALTFEEVYQDHHRFVWRVVRTLGLPPALVEDAVQDVFVVVHRRLPEYEGRAAVRGWLFRIARWVVSQERRRFRTKLSHETIDDAVSDGISDALSDPAPGPFERFVQSEGLRTVERVLNRMEEDKRLVFVLMDIEELKAAEVSEILSINVNTVYSRLRLAREQFRRLLSEGESRRERMDP